MQVDSEETKKENGEQKLYDCQYCDKKFTLRQHLNSHTKRKHSQERPYTCKFCTKKFLTRWELIKHLRSKSKHDKSQFQEIKEFIEQMKQENPQALPKPQSVKEQSSQEDYYKALKKMMKEKQQMEKYQHQQNQYQQQQETYIKHQPLMIEEGIYLEENDEEESYTSQNFI